MKISIYDFLKNFDKVYIEVNPEFTDFVKEQIIEKYGSLREYGNKVLKISYPTIKWAFQRRRYHKFKRLLTIAKSLNITKEKVFEEIKGFYHWGSHRKNSIIIPREISINPFFVEGYALYLAEGDTGFSGVNKPRKLRFTNSELSVIEHYVKWLRTYFPDIYFYVNLIFPKNSKLINKEKEKVIKKLDINKNQLKISKGYYNKQIKYRVCLDQAIIIDLILALEETIKTIVKNNRKLAASYVRGMMIGEGTAYCNRSKYVRIEMKNKKEIDFVGNLLDLLGITFNKSCRSTREEMWSIYIGGKENIRRYAKLVGFGVHRKRQKVLDNILKTDKKLIVGVKQSMKEARAGKGKVLKPDKEIDKYFDIM